MTNLRYQEVSEQILAYIDKHGLRTGDRLPPERELSEILKASRTSVRRAIKLFTETGLLVSQPGSGTFVTGSSSAGADTCVMQMSFNNSFTMEQLLEFRVFLECSIVELAAMRITDADLKELKAIVYDQERAVANNEDESPHIVTFHQKLAQIARNPIFIQLMNALNECLENRRRNAGKNKLLRRRISSHWHHNIIKSLENRDVGACVREMWTHIHNSMDDSCPLNLAGGMKNGDKFCKDN